MKLKPFYVYELVDPSNNQTFYVGKGQGRRGHDHRRLSNTNRISDKLKRIKEIESKGSEVIARVVGRFENEKEAFAVEATLIHWMYGYDNLTNIQPGHGSSTIREKGCFEELEGIDIPERVIGTRTGDYSKEHVEKRIRYKVEESLKRIKNYLENNTPHKFSDVDISNPRWTTIFIIKNGVRLAVGRYNSPAEYFWIEVRSLDTKKENRKKVIELCGLSDLEYRNKGEYAILPELDKQLMTPERVLDDFEKYYSQI